MFIDLIKNALASAAETASRPLYSCSCSSCAGGANTEPQFAITPGQAAQSASMTGLNSTGAETLMSGNRWTGTDAAGKTVVTYSFANASSQYSADSAGFASTLMAFSAADKALVRTMLSNISAVCNVTFVEVADSGAKCGAIRYAYSQAPADMGYAGYAFYPSEGAIGGDVWLSRTQAEAKWDFYRPNLLLHETLHALGLKHPFDPGAQLDGQSDIIPNTVMSYSPIAGSQSGYLASYPAEPMPLDIAALQAMYGAASRNAGDTTYDLSSASFRGFHAIWDSAGNDLLDAGRVGQSVLLDLNAGARSDIGQSVRASAYFGQALETLDYTSTLAIAPGAVIERANGSAFDDVLLGNDYNNVLSGGAGGDRLEGAGGDDLLAGGAGNDTLDGGAGTDTASFSGSIANFRIEKSGETIHITDRFSGQGMDLLSNVEKLYFTDMRMDLTVQDAAAAVSEARLQAVVELYLGFFNRVPDAEGLTYWLAKMNEGMTTAQVAEQFYDAALQYSSLTGYTAQMSNQDFIRVIYKNVLGRSSVDADGLAYWSGALADGSKSRGALLESILSDAHAFEGDAQWGYVADLLDNKYEVGKTFAVDMGLTWNTAEQSITKGMQIAAAVTPTDMNQALLLIGVAPQDMTGF